MTSRSYSDWSDQETQDLVKSLLKVPQTPIEYRSRMESIGMVLGHYIWQHYISEAPDLTLIVSTADDADFLTRGLMTAIEAIAGEGITRLCCFWNGSGTIGEKKIRPIKRSYSEIRAGDQIRYVIIVKSIIATACTVRTNLLESLSKTNPEKIFVTAPVMWKNAPSLLSEEFPSAISDKFDYVFIAQDEEKDDQGIVKPGIGGSVYDLYDVEKMKHRPVVLSERRHRYSG